jgi:hypothetical protein
MAAAWEVGRGKARAQAEAEAESGGIRRTLWELATKKAGSLNEWMRLANFRLRFF